MPFLSWWPKGTHRSNWGTNYDLPVGHIDLFATYADILGYPLPAGDKCIYAFDSNTAAINGQDENTIGRPMKKAKETPRAYCSRVGKGIQEGNGTYVGENTGWATQVQLRFVSGGSDYLLER